MQKAKNTPTTYVEHRSITSKVVFINDISKIKHLPILFIKKSW